MMTSRIDTPKHLETLADVAGLYDGFILDLWGVVHDGLALFPETLPTLATLKKLKKKVWLLSNAPRRAGVIAAKLAEMGLRPNLYGGLLTSGEESWHALRDTLIEQWGRRCLHIGAPSKDSSLYDGLDLELVDDPARADFVLNSGVRDLSDNTDMYMPLLKACAERKLPMLCANPDKVVHVKEQLVICAGTLAEAYAALDGDVTSFGKPYRDVYSHCLREMGTSNVLAIGDSMLTDIAGATGAGLDSVLVTSGIHRDAFDGTKPQTDRPEDFFSAYLFRPNYTISTLSL